jgi:hypothetical protein
VVVLKWILFAPNGIVTQHDSQISAETFKKQLISEGISSNEITIISETEYWKRFK